MIENMNLRFLIFSNPLVVDKISKKFLYWKDSGFIFTKNMISSFPNEWRFTWCVPENISKEDETWFLEANENVSLLRYPYSTNMHQNRYEFYGNAIKKEFPYPTDVDVVISNLPEISANIAVYFENQRRDSPFILNFFHWIDCEESRSFASSLGGYFWRELDGAISATKNYFHNQYAFSLFNNMINGELKNIRDFNIGYFHPPATTFGKGNVPELDGEDKIILFNHRLNNTTNWKSFLKAVDIVRETHLDKKWKVWFTDDSDKQKVKQVLEGREDFVLVKSLPKETYGSLLEKSHFSVCMHKGYSTWNMAVIDALKENCMVIVPSGEPVYKYMFGKVPSMFHSNKASDVAVKIKELLMKDKESLTESAKEVRCLYPDYFETEVMFGEIFNNIDDAFKNSIKDKSPAKFDKVLDLIKDRKRITKRELVNTFWSYHVNSNFQKIRWKLLSMGIMDDVSEKDTTYYIHP